MTKLLGNEPNKLPEPAEEAFVIHTRAQTRRLQVEERRRLQKEQESGAQPHPIDDNTPSREKESDHKVESNEEEVEARSEDTRIVGEEEGANPETEEEVMISNEFEEDLFNRSKERTKQTRSQKRAARQVHFTEMPLSKHPMDISTEEFHQLQEVDGTLEGIHRAAGGHVSTAGAGFFKHGEVIYRRWTPPGREEGETSSLAHVDRLSSKWPTPFRLLNTWEETRQLSACCDAFTGQPCTGMWLITVGDVLSARRRMVIEHRAHH